MIPFERIEKITEALNESRYLTIEDLLTLTDSSLTTIRRDINYLLEQGKIEKIRGGIVSVKKTKEDNISYLYENRQKLFLDAKEKIGKEAQTLIEDRDVIVLTYGTTTAQIARFISPEKHLTIITNGLDIVSILKDKPNIETILLGGVVDYSYNVVVGPTVSQMLDNFNPGKIFMGAGGITEEQGITGYNYMNSLFLKNVMHKIQKRIVVVDHTKFGRNTLVQIAPLNEIDIIVTDGEMPVRYKDIFKKNEIICKIVS